MYSLGVYLSTIQPKKSSVVPFTIVTVPDNVLNTSLNKLYFLFGVDSSTGDITDFSGGVRKNESGLTGGLRKLKEESSGVIETEYTKLNNSIGWVAYVDRDFGRSTFFLGLPSNKFEDLPLKFALTKKSHPQRVSQIIFLEWVDVLKVIYGRHPKYKMWTGIRNFYKNVFTSELSKMLRVVYPYY